jgi:LysR family transcriptional regulator, cys regulon transcriptional activator
MKLQQLRYICEVARQNLNLSTAAATLFTSQPGISRQIRSLEEELGVDIFVRHGKRVVAVTEPGKAILDIAQRMLKDVENLKQVGEEYTEEDHGHLSIATTHTQARYALPQVIQKFTKRYPGVRLSLRQGSPTQISEYVVSGEADMAIATEAMEHYDKLVTLPCYRWNRRTKINQAFTEKGLKPNVVLTAIDSDVIKTYVELGLGVGIVAMMAFDPKRDTHVKAIDASHLFEPSTTRIGIRKNSYLRGYTYDFIEMFAPHLTRESVNKVMRG